MTEFVRVKDDTTGHESSVPKRFAEAYDGKGFKILAGKDAADANGRGLPAKTSVKELQNKEPETETNEPAYSAPMATDPTSKPTGGKTR